MNTALIIICIVFCIGIVLYAVTHFGVAIGLDRKFRVGITRYHAKRRLRGGRPTT